jgi:hypothetical protein
VNEFPFDTHECCPACGDPEEDGVLCDDCADMVRNDPRTFQSSGAIERTCESCGEPADSLGWCEGMRTLMECKPKPRPGNPCVYKCGEVSSHYTLYVCDSVRMFGRCGGKPTKEDGDWADRAFLNSCGIAVDPLPTRGVVTVQMAICREVVQKHKNQRVGKPVGRLRESVECYDLGIIE